MPACGFIDFGVRRCLRIWIAIFAKVPALYKKRSHIPPICTVSVLLALSPKTKINHVASAFHGDHLDKDHANTIGVKRNKRCCADTAAMGLRQTALWNRGASATGLDDSHKI